MAEPHAETLRRSFVPELASGRFGASLTEPEVRRFQKMLRDQCGLVLPLPEAWSRAIELLSLVEMLIGSRGALEETRNTSPEFALPRS